MHHTTPQMDEQEILEYIQELQDEGVDENGIIDKLRFSGVSDPASYLKKKSKTKKTKK